MHGAQSWHMARGPRLVGLNLAASKWSKTVFSLGFIGAAAFVTLLPTVLNKYLFCDETWYTARELLSWPNGWGALGRPLLHYVMRLTERFEASFGLDAIYIYRLAGIVLLATTGALVFAWLRRFDTSRFHATLYSVGLISLPAFQVLAATSVQLGAALIATLLAGHLFVPFLNGAVTRWDGICRIVASTVLCFVALCIYQVSFLMLPAMLLLPMLQTSRRDVRRFVALGLTYAGFAVITAVYFAAWKLLYVAPADGVNAQYDPNGAALAAVVSGLKAFIPGAFHQVANLWYVEDVAPSPFFYLSVPAVLIAVGRLLYIERLFGLLKVVVAIGTLLVCDVFRLAANHQPTYTTLHALSAAWWFLLVWSIQSILGHRVLAKGIAALATAIGLLFATWTNAFYISGHNAAQFLAIEQGMLSRPDFAQAHIFGAAENYPQLYEYGWTSGSARHYTNSMAQLIANRRFGRSAPRINISNVSDPGPPTGGAATDGCEKPDLAIRLPSPGNRCAGLACSLSSAQIDGIDWKNCKLDTASN
jgi:hypothetical protein